MSLQEIPKRFITMLRAGINNGSQQNMAELKQRWGISCPFEECFDFCHFSDINEECEGTQVRQKLVSTQSVALTVALFFSL